MTIEFFTGFEGCASTADVSALLGRPFDYSATGGYNSGKGISKSKYSSYIFTLNCVAAKTVAFGMHINGSAVYEYDSSIKRYGTFSFVGPTISVYNTSSGLTVYRSGVQIGTCTVQLSSSMNHIEAICFSDATVGTFQLKVNGTLVIDLTNVDTGGQDITGIELGNMNVTPVYDNIYIADSLQGELYSVLIRPSSDIAVAFTPSTGTDNYAMIDEVVQDGDSTYVESDTIGNQDLYGYDDVAVGLIPLFATIVTIARKEGTGVRELTIRAKQDLTEYDIGSSISLSPSYPDSDTNPAIVDYLSEAPDGTAWTREKINAMQFGFKVEG